MNNNDSARTGPLLLFSAVCMFAIPVPTLAQSLDEQLLEDLAEPGVAETRTAEQVQEDQFEQSLRQVLESGDAETSSLNPLSKAVGVHAPRTGAIESRRYGGEDATVTRGDHWRS